MSENAQEFDTTLSDKILADATKPTPGGHEAPTDGYDTVFAVSLAGINQAIKDAGHSVRKLNWPQQGPFKFGLKADLDHWKMVPSGDGASIHFALPMTNVKAPYVYQGTKGEATCDALTAYISIKLHVQPHSGPAILPDGTTLGAPPKGTTRHALKVLATLTDPKDPIVSIEGIDYIKPLSEDDAKDNIHAMILSWATAHLKDFEHVFSYVDLNDQIDKGKWAFCKPHTSTYAYVDDVSGNDGHLGLLCMTSDQPAPTIQQITGFAIPQGSDCSFLISRQRFMHDMIIPGLLHMWPNLKKNDLVIAKDNRHVHLKDKTQVTLPDFVAKDGNTYTPVLHYFVVEIDGSEVTVHTQTAVEVSWGIYATCDSTSFFNVAIGKNKKGEQTFTFKKARKGHQVNGHYASPGIQILKTVLLVIGIVLAVLSMVVDGWAGGVVALALIVCLVGQYELNNIGEWKKYDAPSFEGLRAAFTGPITWNSKHMKLLSSGLHGSLQLGGHFH